MNMGAVSGISGCQNSVLNSTSDIRQLTVKNKSLFIQLSSGTSNLRLKWSFTLKIIVRNAQNDTEHSMTTNQQNSTYTKKTNQKHNIFKHLRCKFEWF